MYTAIQEKKFNVWKHGLLDISKRNKMMNYRKTKRTTLDISFPDLPSLFKRIAVDEESISFRKRVDTSRDIRLTELLYLMDRVSVPVELSTGEISSNVSTEEMNRTLKQLRTKARLSQEEQGINILYLSFGFLEWRQKANDNLMRSPLVLVPVSIELQSITSPFTLSRLDEDIVINPTLEYVLASDFGIQLPEFEVGSNDILDYLNTVDRLVQPSGWRVVQETNLGLLSFLKIVMYKDLEKYKERIFTNPVVQAFCGDVSSLPKVKDDWHDFNHDTIPCMNTWQVVNADSSQQDAILLSKKGVSFVLQGPPGTGKSQTITNIIAEALAVGKKVLFVSEKMAALSVVYRRLQEVGLADYCLSLHNYKAEKKRVIQELVNTLDAPSKKLRPGVTDFLETLENERFELNNYVDELYKVRKPLNKTIYEVITDLVMFENVPLYKITDDLQEKNEKEYKNRIAVLKRLREFLDKYQGKITDNPWRNSNIAMITYDIQNDIDETLKRLEPALFGVASILSFIDANYGVDHVWSWNGFSEFCGQLQSALLLKSIKQRINSYYDTKFCMRISGELATELCGKYTQLVEQCEESGLSVYTYDTAAYREKINERFRTDLEYVNRIRNWILAFNKRFGTSFDSSMTGFQEIQSVLKAGMMIDIFEDSWILNKTEDEAIKISQDAMYQLKQVSSAREDLYKYLTERIINCGSYQRILPLSECWEYYDGEKEYIRLLQKQLVDVRCQIKNNAVSESEYRTRQFRKSAIIGCLNQIDRVNTVIGFIDDVKKSLLINLGYNKQSIVQAIDIISVLDVQYDFTMEWFIGHKLDMVNILAGSRQMMVERLNELKAQIDQEWNADFYKTNATEMLGRFRTDYSSFFKRLGSSYRQDKRTLSSTKKNLYGKLEDSTCLSALELLQEYQSTLERFNGSENEMRELLGNYYDGLQTNWNTYHQMLKAVTILDDYVKKYGISESVINKELFEKDYRMRGSIKIGNYSVHEWSKNGKIEEIASLVNDIETADFSKELLRAENKKSILEKIDTVVSAVEEHTLKEYSFLTNAINTMNTKNDVSFGDLETYIMTYVSFIEKVNEYNFDIDIRKKTLPRLFKGSNTDWSEIISAALLVKSFNSKIGHDCNRSAVFEWLSKDRDERAEEKIADMTIREGVSSAILQSSEKLFALYDENLDHTAQQLQKYINTIQGLNKYYDLLSEYIADKDLIQSLKETQCYLLRYIETIRIIKKIESRLFDYFQAYNIEIGDEENLQEIEELFENYIDKDAIQESIGKIWDSFTHNKTEITNSMLDVFRSCEEVRPDNSLICRFNAWFRKEDFESYSIGEVINRVVGCKNQEYLHAWMNYSDIVSACEKEGLGDYIEYLLSEERVCNKYIVTAYQKGFLTKWLMDYLVDKNITSLLKFQSYLHETSIENFKQNDALQLKTAQARLAEKLSQEKPSGVNHMANAMDEISILRKESNKRSRIMPLRKLFKVIPSLLQKLKPCFMMSPLSVSYFLDSDMYQFDLVIFDEASQILPEDAIGTIYRGKQVIIVGDTRQMPPTNFFNATSKNDEEFDTDSDDEDVYIPDIVSESVLDEANTCLPSCTLLWHYRSKDESLIAFSNKSIYDNKLITFPNCRRGTDRGLEYIYVPNGCYHDRSNLMEAKKCVQLVAEHIAKHPDRSLGVIAFSEKQQGVIEDAINDFRLQNPSCEDFFSENNEEPFFVKNLENVQGDERDTIIFSICYGKNNQGHMYMRFGPLGRAGGERRLNVAITRAKYNVKLVGSILPTDIDMSKTGAEGVRLLREYIYYAMQNDYGMPLGSDTGATDEYFIDMIADYLYENGYKIRRNVGESEYKVDIAVIHPDYDDEYFAGIECDGQNYIMARTARDRDVLRKNIMHTMGWEIHHVWSFNWYKNPQQERESLLTFLKDASEKFIESKKNVSQPVKDVDMALFEDVSINDMTVEKNTSSEIHKLRFAQYEVCNPFDAVFVRSWDNYKDIAQWIMYVMDKEAPIHKELMYRRLAPIFGNQKATAPIRRTIDDCIRRMLSTKIVIQDDFMYLSEGSDIKARIPKTENDSRTIDYICPEEIQDAIMTIIEFAYGLTLNDLIGEVARNFGFARTGPKIKQRIEDNYMVLYNKGQLKESNGKIYLKEV